MKPLLGSGCRGSGLFFLVQVLILLRRRMAAQNNGGPAYAAAVAAAPGVSRQAPEVFRHCTLFSNKNAAPTKCAAIPINWDRAGPRCGHRRGAAFAFLALA